MNKKLIFIPALAALTTSLYFVSLKSPTTKEENPVQKESNTRKTSEDATKSKLVKKARATTPSKSKGVDKIERKHSYLSDKIKQQALWGKLSNPYATNQEILSEFDKEEILKFSKELITEIHGCIKDFCGIKAQNHRGYFDPQNTSAHVLIERSLSLASLLNNEGNNQLSDDFLEKLFSIDNDAIQSLAFELYQSNEMSSEKFQKAVKYIENFTDNAKAQSLVLLEKSSKSDTSLRDEYINVLSTSLRSNDSASVEVAKSLDYLDLSKDEIEQVMDSICHLRKPSSSQQNWLAMKYHLEQYSESRNYQVSLADRCQ